MMSNSFPQSFEVEVDLQRVSPRFGNNKCNFGKVKIVWGQLGVKAKTGLY
jgi:hypothetical protein